jgi:hypothetical protein
MVGVNYPAHKPNSKSFLDACEPVIFGSVFSGVRGAILTKYHGQGRLKSKSLPKHGEAAFFKVTKRRVTSARLLSLISLRHFFARERAF